MTGSSTQAGMLYQLAGGNKPMSAPKMYLRQRLSGWARR